jgi:hypothetical protein
MVPRATPPVVLEDQPGQGAAICADALGGPHPLYRRRIGIDNNPAERSLRGIAITRKNVLFLGSEAGGERAAVIYTVLESAKLNRLDPEAYLADVIDRMAKGHSISRLSELLPWNWHQLCHRLCGVLPPALPASGIEVSHETVRAWETKLLPVMGDALRKSDMKAAQRLFENSCGAFCVVIHPMGVDQ